MPCTVDEELLPFVTTHPSARQRLIWNVYEHCSQPPSLAREGLIYCEFARKLYFQHPHKSKFEHLIQQKISRSTLLIFIFNYIPSIPLMNM